MLNRPTDARPMRANIVPSCGVAKLAPATTLPDLDGSVVFDTILDLLIKPVVIRPGVGRACLGTRLQSILSDGIGGSLKCAPTCVSWDLEVRPYHCALYHRFSKPLRRLL